LRLDYNGLPVCGVRKGGERGAGRVQSAERRLLPGATFLAGGDDSDPIHILSIPELSYPQFLWLGWQVVAPLPNARKPAAAPPIIMKVAILDDWHDTLRQLPSFEKLAPFEVTVYNDHVDDIDLLVERLAAVEALVLIRERTAVRRPLIERLPNLRLISQRSVYPHVDVEACTERGVLLCSNMHADTPSYATAEMTWALLLAAARQLPQQMASLKAGTWQLAPGM
jgi:hypothetical protein